MKTEIKKVHNRALLKTRPTKSHELRKIDNSNKQHPCNPENGGHDYRFLIKDSYGCCKKCGDELLT